MLVFLPQTFQSVIILSILLGVCSEALDYALRAGFELLQLYVLSCMCVCVHGRSNDPLGKQ